MRISVKNFKQLNRKIFLRRTHIGRGFYKPYLITKIVKKRFCDGVILKHPIHFRLILFRHFLIQPYFKYMKCFMKKCQSCRLLFRYDGKCNKKNEPRSIFVHISKNFLNYFHQICWICHRNPHIYKRRIETEKGIC